jgi:sarcosine oxidase subunit gamma
MSDTPVKQQARATVSKESAVAWLQDYSAHQRLGVKGPQASAWLQQRSVPLPDRANSWRALTDDPAGMDVIVRLGANEYFVEQSGDGVLTKGLARELESPMTGVYPVLREDRALLLGGEQARSVLAQTCNVNFDGLPDSAAAVMTMMIGVAVLVVPQGYAAQRRYRIWCDPSYGDYLWSSLQLVVGELQ